MKDMKKKILTHVGLVAIMLAAALIYFSPILDGKKLYQGDTQKYASMVKETKDYHAKTGEYVHWNSAMFSGMPGYQVGGNPPVKSVFTPIKNILTLKWLGMDENAGVLFFYLIGFYVAMIALGCSPWLSLLAALAFGLGSYNIIIIEAGHITKAWSLAMMAPIFAGMILCLRYKKNKGDLLWGGLLFVFALSLQLHCNHIQITYYTIIGALLLGLFHFVYALKDKRIGQFATGLGVLLCGCVLAFACNSRNLMVSQQYAKHTMRGGNAITVTPEDLYHDGEPASIGGRKSGLDIDYAFSWSYGVGETYTLLVPGAMGGGSTETVSRESASYKAFHQEQMPLYWGDQPFTSGPVYFGAIVVFFFLLGLIMVKGPERWWLLAATVLAILMSWGRNLLPLNEWLFNHLPMYNKFRTPSMSLVLANVAMVMMGILGLRQMFSSNVDSKKKRMALYISAGVSAILLFGGLVICGGFSYSGASDAQMAPQYGAQWQQIQNVFIQDRKALFVSDTWRSIILIVLAFAVMWLYVRLSEKTSAKPWLTTMFSVILVILVAFDLWGVDRRYLNDSKYVSENQLKLRPDSWDMAIDQQAAYFGDEDYRVLNMATNTFNDSKPAAFHHQIGGYSAVKMRRYQDIIDFYFSRHINMQILNMLNARYFVDRTGQVQRNPDALGNVWFVREIKRVDDANSEIMALNDFDPSTTAIVDQSAMGYILNDFTPVPDSMATIAMEHQHPYNPDYVKYNSHSTTDQFAVFSEVYYEPDWRVYIDGKPAKYVRANYILRAMVVPAGDHVIEFRNEAPLFHRMDTVTILGSIVLILISAGAIILYYRTKKNDEDTDHKIQKDKRRS